ncbi:MAG: TlpA disulfide reductase family protein [Bacteroidales bacterium]|nr:TlpA disulfide reductase family protein [Bacteroidales bacterium]
MRKLIWIMLAIIALQACDQKNETYNIEVSLEGSEGKWIKLLAREDRNYVTHDSVLAEAGSAAVLKKGVKGVTTMYLTVEDAEGSIRLLVDNSNYSIRGNMDDFEIETDSKPQSDLNNYNETLKLVREKMNELVTELRKSPDPENPAKSDSLREAYYALYEKQDAMDSIYIAENPASYASVLALRNTFYTLDTEGLETALARLDAPLHQMEEYIYMYGKLERMKAVNIGQPYTDFGLETPEGEILKVSDVHQGGVLLIDFWASWCGPCRRANPEVVEIYHEYHDLGFDILGVSLDRDSASWIKAIEDDHLVWNHISDLKYWNSEGAELYGVPAIPHTVLIDRNGIITAKNLRGDELREAIESLL